MRAFASFLVVLILVGAIGYAGLIYLRDNADKFQQDSLPARIGQDMRPSSAPPPPPASGPRDYHLLEAQGGIPLAEAEQAGLVTDKWAYLSALAPVQQSEGVQPAAAAVRSLNYDHSWRFASTPPQYQYLEYTLGGKWDELHFGFGFADSEPSDPSNVLAIEFSILLDGKAAFGPRRLTPVDRPAFGMLDLRGVNRLVFSSKRIGTGNYFAPLLLDPFVKAADPAVADENRESGS